MSPGSSQTDLAPVIDALWKSLGLSSRSALWDAAGITNKNYWNKRLAGTVPTAKKHIDQLVEGLRQAGHIVTPRQEADLRTAIGMMVTIQGSSDPTEQRSQERLARLRAMLADHSGFIHDRLASFVGREQELADIRQRIAELMPTGGYITITGQAGQGKSSIIAKLVDEYRPDNTPHHFIPFNTGPDHQVELLQNLMARLILKYDLPEFYAAGHNRAMLRGIFPNLLQEVAKKCEQEVIFIDGLDQIQEDANGERDLSFLPNNPPSRIVFVLSTRPNDTLRPLQLLKPHNQYDLPGLSRTDFDLILHHRGVTLNTTVTDRFYAVMLQNALYLDLLAQELATSKSLPTEAIVQQVADDPNALFSFIIGPNGRLSRWIEWERVGLPILRFLLVALQPLSEQALQHLIDIPLIMVKRGLLKLGGLVTRDSDGRYYLYHLKLGTYLRRDIFAEDEIIRTHQHLVEWCIDSRGELESIWEDTFANMLEQERRTYVRRHYISHLYYAEAWQELWSALDKGIYGRGKLRYDSSNYSYARDLDLGRRAATRPEWNFEEGLALLPNLWRYTLLYCSLIAKADEYPDALYEVMVLVGREQEAISLAELLTDNKRKIHILGLIGTRLTTQAGREREGLQVLLRATSIARAVADADHRGFLLTKIAEIFSQVGHAQQALTLFDEAAASSIAAGASKSISNLQSIVKALSQAGYIEDAIAIVYRIRDPSCHASGLHDIAQQLAQTGQTERALALLDEAIIAARTVEPSSTHDYFAVIRRTSVLHDIAQQLAQTGQTERALALLDEAIIAARTIDAPPRRASALRDIAQALSQIGRQKLALELLNDAVAIVASNLNNRHFSYAFDLQTIVLELAKMTDIEAIIVAALAIDHPYLYVETLGYIAQTLTKVGASDQARLLIHKALTSVHNIWDRQQPSALKSVIQALAQLNDIEQIEAIVRTIGDSSRWEEDLQAITRKLAEAGYVEQSIAISLMIADEFQRAKALTEIAKSLIHTGNHAQVLVLLDKATSTAPIIAGSSDYAKVLTSTVSIVAQSGLYQQAEIRARTIKDLSQRAEALAFIARTLAEGGQLDRAYALLNEVFVVTHTIADDESRAKALKRLVDSLAKARQYQQAETLACTITNVPQRANALALIACTLAQDGQQDEAHMLLNKAVAAHIISDDPQQRIKSLQTVVEALVQLHQQNRALVLINEAVETAHIYVDSMQREKASSIIAGTLAEVGQWQTAKSFAGKIQDIHGRAYTFQNIAEIGANAGLIQWAKATVDMIDDTLLRASAIAAIAPAFYRAGEKEQALRLLDEATELATIATDTGEIDEAWADIARAFARMGHWEEAESYVRSIHDVYERSWGLAYIAESLALAGMSSTASPLLNEAITAAEGIKASYLEVSVRVFIAHILTTIGDQRRMIQLLQQCWLHVTKRNELLELLGLADGLIVRSPELAVVFVEAFVWVDDFLKE